MSGALVGKCLIEGGASCLKMLTCRRDKESGYESQGYVWL